jgi:(E)-4-hydroxy-3-methyl-but-2-enyl pyrophosphate reductase
MQVIIPKLSGFCPGVRNAEKKLLRENKRINPGRIYAYGNIINNSNYIEYLSRQNIHTLENVDTLKHGSYVAIRTHGINKQEEERLQNIFKLIDLTCINVKRVQLSILDHTERGYFIVITGKKNHPEIKGLISYARDFKVIETKNELEHFLKSIVSLLKQKSYHKFFIVSQTTGSKDIFENTVHSLKKICTPQIEIAVSNSICPITNRKEEEALRLQQQVDITFVVGDTLSSNANKLYNILAKEKKTVYFIADLKELRSLKLPLARYKRALLVSSASTPFFIEDEIRIFLENV